MFCMEILVGSRKINMYQIVVVKIKTAVIGTEGNVNISKSSPLKFRAITCLSQKVRVNVNASSNCITEWFFLKQQDHDYVLHILQAHIKPHKPHEGIHTTSQYPSPISQCSLCSPRKYRHFLLPLVPTPCHHMVFAYSPAPETSASQLRHSNCWLDTVSGVHRISQGCK